MTLGQVRKFTAFGIQLAGAWAQLACSTLPFPSLITSSPPLSPTLFPNSPLPAPQSAHSISLLSICHLCIICIVCMLTACYLCAICVPTTGPSHHCWLPLTAPACCSSPLVITHSLPPLAGHCCWSLLAATACHSLPPLTVHHPCLSLAAPAH